MTTGTETEQTKLTDRKLQSLKGTKDGLPYDVRDTEVRGLRVRVMGSGDRTFVLLARFSKGANPTRRALGSYPVMSLAEARDKAVAWKKLIDKGIDPAEEEARKRANTFASVAEEFIGYIHRQKLRTANVMERHLREMFIKEAKWGPKPITHIAADDIKRIIRKSVEADAKYQASTTLLLSAGCSIGRSAPTTTACKSIRAIGSTPGTSLDSGMPATVCSRMTNCGRSGAPRSNSAIPMDRYTACWH